MNKCCGISVVFLLWKISCGIFVVTCSVFECFVVGWFAVESLLWSHRC